MSQLDQLARVFAARARVRILEELLKSGPLTADVLAQRLERKAVTIHHHLRVLGKAGAVEEDSPERSGRSGRPSTIFRVSGRTNNLNFPPRHYDLLSDVALGVLAAMTSPEALRRTAQKVGRQLGKQLGAALLARSGLERWTMADFRNWFVDVHATEMGCSPEVLESRADRLRYRFHNCIVLESARKYPEFVCAMDAPMISAAACATMGRGKGTKVCCMGQGAPYCEYIVTR